ncbi:MAG: S4 domain protein [Firmicutes bacterium ADurb.Bin193]|nr:MAG: S4 domain protein [Firmicutes bacterium ADurb.Bin193]
MTKEREEMLAFAKNDDERKLLCRLYDIAQGARQHHSVKSTQFLNGHELLLAQRALSKCCSVCFSAYGGYDEAERRVISFSPDGDDFDYGICIIKASINKEVSLSHRDWLGSLLSLGIRREKIGDIIPMEGGAYIVCCSDIGEYIMSNLESVANTPVHLLMCDDNEIITPEKRYKEIRSTVPSLRLDCILSAGINLSRSDSASLIKSGRVSVNWEVIESPSHIVREKQIISVKGIGRLELFEIRNETKKGRTAVTIKRFL